MGVWVRDRGNGGAREALKGILAYLDWSMGLAGMRGCRRVREGDGEEGALSWGQAFE